MPSPQSASEPASTGPAFPHASGLLARFARCSPISTSLDFATVFTMVTSGDTAGSRTHCCSPLFWQRLFWSNCQARRSGNGSNFSLDVFVSGSASHGFLDAMTDGGLGVAFFSPADNTRFFLPFTPIRVSLIGVSRFFSARGFAVLKSELVWIWLPTALLIAVLWLSRAVWHRSIRGSSTN